MVLLRVFWGCGGFRVQGVGVFKMLLRFFSLRLRVFTSKGLVFCFWPTGHGFGFHLGPRRQNEAQDRPGVWSNTGAARAQLSPAKHLISDVDS